MRRAEELAKEVYSNIRGDATTIANLRFAYKNGYEQALKDAMQWLTDHIKDYIDYDKDGSIGNFDDDALLEGFNKAMR